MADDPKTTPAPEQEGVDGDAAQVDEPTPEEEPVTSEDKIHQENEAAVDSAGAVHKENGSDEENQAESESPSPVDEPSLEVEETRADGSVVSDQTPLVADQQSTLESDETGEAASDESEATSSPEAEKLETDTSEEPPEETATNAEKAEVEHESDAEEVEEATAEAAVDEVAVDEEESGVEPKETEETAEPAAEEEEQEEAVDETGEDEQEEAEKEPEDNKKWYVVKVQSGREESIRDAIERRVKIEGLEDYFDQIVIPVEKETVMQKSKRVTRERKLFPGYIMAKVDFNDQILYLFRETSGVGDFVGGSLTQQPQPMSDTEVARMFGEKPETTGKKAGPKTESPFSEGDQVKVKDGVFSGMDGVVREVLPEKDMVRVEVFVLGRAVSVELEYWQVDPI